MAASRAGRPRPDSAAFIVNDSLASCRIAADFGERKPVSCHIVDATRMDAEIDFTDALSPHSFMLVEFA